MRSAKRGDQRYLMVGIRPHLLRGRREIPRVAGLTNEGQIAPLGASSGDRRHDTSVTDPLRRRSGNHILQLLVVGWRQQNISTPRIRGLRRPECATDALTTEQGD